MTDLTDRTTHLFTPVGVASRPTSAKKARTATVVRATKDSKSEPEEDSKSEPEEDSKSEPEESGFWRKVFLPDGKEEVKAGDYQKFQAELKAQKEANAKKAAEKEGGCVIM